MKIFIPILFLFISIFISSCSKENSTEPEVNSNLDTRLQKSVWFNSAENSGIVIEATGKTRLLEVDEEGRLVQSSEQKNSPEFIKAMDGKITIHQANNNSVDTLKGTYEIVDKNLTITIIERNSESLINPITDIYKQSSLNALVIFKKYLKAKVQGNYKSFDYVSISYGNQSLLVSGSISFEGSISIRCNATGPGSYDFAGQNKAVYVNSSGTVFSTEGSYTGTLYIQNYDTENRYISGTFSFEAQNNGIVIEVTDGKFGGIY